MSAMNASREFSADWLITALQKFSSIPLRGGPLDLYIRTKFLKRCTNPKCPLKSGDGYNINPRLSGCFGEHRDIDWLVSIAVSRSIDTFEKLPFKFTNHCRMFQKFMEILQSKASSGVVPNLRQRDLTNAHAAFACRF